MIKVRFAALALALFLILAAASAALMTACSDAYGPGGRQSSQSSSGGDDSPGVRSDGDEGTPALTEPAFSDAKYGGEDFTVYMRSHKAANYPGRYIVPEEGESDVISLEAVRRNYMVEERFDIHLKAVEVTDPYKTIPKDIQSGAPGYDICLDRRNKLGPIVLDGSMVNLNRLGLDLRTGWWDVHAYESYSYAGKVYLMPNDVSISNLGGVEFFYFSKAVLEDFGLTSPYDYAARNEWTLDNFIGLVKGVSAPGADGKIGVYGLVAELRPDTNYMLVGCGVPWIETDADGNISCGICTTYADRTQTFIEKFRTVTENKDVCQTYDEATAKDPAGSGSYNDKYAHARGLFAQDHFLFVHANMSDAAYEFIDMSKGFGVIMNPKFDSDQKEYYHKMDTNCVIWGVRAAGSVDLDRGADVTDDWAYVSTSTVVEAYYELTLKTKRASDPVAAETLDTVKASICYYLTDLYGNSSIDIGGMVEYALKGSVSKAGQTYGRPLTSGLSKLKAELDKLPD
jgi:ABC-type glycerol-3-phosphate transport system substrate-binding protein